MNQQTPRNELPQEGPDIPYHKFLTPKYATETLQLTPEEKSAYDHLTTELNENEIEKRTPTSHSYLRLISNTMSTVDPQLKALHESIARKLQKFNQDMGLVV